MTRDEFTEFYAGSKDRCLRAAIAYGMAPDRAEEAVAEAFARAWSRWPSVRSVDSPRAWIVRTAINADISWWRKRRRETAVPETPEQLPRDDSSFDDLLEAVRRLPPRQRQVVALRYFLDLDAETTGHELGIARGTVSATLHQALKTLRQRLTDSEGMLS
ncbi:RNA polymerase sigma-E factor [Nocardioidaceae bacterium Broad-1]|uniref:sigma-70 family RNA polymerase sigma factor n=1 Tax=Nocardioides luteus TaxID=1844 RepID=UPI0002028EA7|nr:sigma-70 family RNA polymerase sigma factor [Nocardioides luteus]EGD40336.1 RNA polymerase sigma-E factor [Nocardioidaceae bacterium Broad-1]MBG6095335.1 RNA polymerase sigma-70 factor (ECF subfamily) [Nocardioides luteus]